MVCDNNKWGAWKDCEDSSRVSQRLPPLDIAAARPHHACFGAMKRLADCGDPVLTVVTVVDGVNALCQLWNRTLRDLSESLIVGLRGVGCGRRNKKCGYVLHCDSLPG